MIYYDFKRNLKVQICIIFFFKVQTLKCIHFYLILYHIIFFNKILFGQIYVIKEKNFFSYNYYFFMDDHCFLYIVYSIRQSTITQ